MNIATTTPSLDVDFSKMATALDEMIQTLKPEPASKDISYDALNRFHSIMAPFWYLICLAGVTSNVINIRTFFRMGLDDSVTISFFFLAVSDFSYCFVAFLDLTFWLVDLIDRLHGPFYFYATPIVFSFICAWIRKGFLISSILITTYLALQRSLCVVFPFHVKTLFTKSRTYGALIVIFCFCASCHFAFLAKHTVTVMWSSETNASRIALLYPSSDEAIVVITEVGIGLGLNLSCMAIVVLCMIAMTVSLQKSLRFRKAATTAVSAPTVDPNVGVQKSSKSGDSTETKALIQVALVSLIFVCTNLPLLGNGVATVILPELNLEGASSNIYHLLHNIMFTTELLNSSMNFLVYYRYNTKYRKHFFARRGRLLRA